MTGTAGQRVALLGKNWGAIADHIKTIMLHYGKKDQPQTGISGSKESVRTLNYFYSLLEKL